MLFCCHLDHHYWLVLAFEALSSALLTCSTKKEILEMSLHQNKRYSIKCSSWARVSEQLVCIYINNEILS